MSHLFARDPDMERIFENDSGTREWVRNTAFAGIARPMMMAKTRVPDVPLVLYHGRNIYVSGGWEMENTRDTGTRALGAGLFQEHGPVAHLRRGTRPGTRKIWGTESGTRLGYVPPITIIINMIGVHKLFDSWRLRQVSTCQVIHIMSLATNSSILPQYADGFKLLPEEAL